MKYRIFSREMGKKGEPTPFYLRLYTIPLGSPSLSMRNRRVQLSTFHFQGFINIPGGQGCRASISHLYSANCLLSLLYAVLGTISVFKAETLMFPSCQRTVNSRNRTPRNRRADKHIDDNPPLRCMNPIQEFGNFGHTNPCQ